MNHNFEQLIKEIESIKSMPNYNPYDLSVYTDKKTLQVLKEIDKNRNYSWIKEIWERNKKDLNMTAIKYRGYEFTYKDFFEQSFRYAKALKQNGLKKGNEFICAIENTPEFPFIMGAASLIGARVNLVSAEFDKDYLIEICNRAESEYIFVSDMSFVKFAPALKELKDKKIIPISIDYSLPFGNAFKEITDDYYKLNEEEYNNTLKEFDNIVNIDDFLKQGEQFKGKVIEETGLNDDFTTTYTSGSTGWGRPKGLVHRVRSYTTMGRYHDKEVSGIPSMKGRTTMAFIKTMSDTDFMTNISDTFMQGGIVALEPINDKNFFLTSMLINKPTYAIASKSYWLYVMKKQMNDEYYKNIKLPFLLVPTAVGEPLAANEEKALNKWLRKLQAGLDITKVPIVCMCTGGGDSEHGGIFISIFRSLLSKKPSHFGIKEPIGMDTYGMVDIKALKEDGTYCDFMEPGHLVANSPCSMKHYVNNDEANKRFIVTDAYGKQWGDLGTYGYIDKTNHIYVKSRIKDKTAPIPTYKIEDEILKDTKKIMSCEVVCVDGNYIAHVEKQPTVSFNEKKVIKSASERCKNAFGEEFVKLLYFKIRESFDLLHTGKRNVLALEEEGLSTDCIKASELSKKEKIKILKR